MKLKMHKIIMKIFIKNNAKQMRLWRINYLKMNSNKNYKLNLMVN